MFHINSRKTKIIFLFITLFFISIFNGYSQTLELPKTKEKKPHSAHKATIYSFILPGLGQAYNKKYWKVPIVYAGLGFFTYMIITNSKEYKAYKIGYTYAKAVTDNNPPEGFYHPPNEYAEFYNLEQLKQGRDFYRRNMEFSYILTGLWYLLNVVDASVDAHLFDFKVSQDLSIKVEPCLYNPSIKHKAIPGLKLQIAIPGVFGYK
jgi:hypothetical protein